MRAGTLRQIVTIQVLSGSTPDGYGNTRKAWTNLYTNIPASLHPLSAKESWTAEQTKADASHVVTIRYQSGITSSMRVLFGSRTFTINGIINPEERNISLELLCQEEVG